MFISPEELNTALYAYQIDEITEANSDIAQMAIDAAVEEMKSYLAPNSQTRWRDGRPRYDVAAIFEATAANRNPLIMELCKSIAVWYVCRLSNVDVIHEQVKERYNRAIEWLEKVAGVGKYADAPALSPNLPLLADNPDNPIQPVRSGSHTKFIHDFND